MKCFFLFLFCCPVFAVAQEKALLIEGSSPKLFINHTVAAKENFYSIGRLYNVSPKEIIPFNNMQPEKGLNVGQVVKIPLTGSNFIQKNYAEGGERLIPLYHAVKEKEGLYRIGINHNNVSVDALKKMNNLKNEEVNKGTLLVVGYLIVKKDQSALVAKSEKTETVDHEIKREEKKRVIEKNDSARVLPGKTTAVMNEEKEIPPVKKEKIKDVPVKKEDIPVAPEILKTPAMDFKGGVFSSLFDSQKNGNALVEQTGMAGIFKSTSGWNDGKYYCLYNNATPGTIIKITFTNTGRSVYAKVLDMMPDIKQNNGLMICLSNAAAAELNTPENNFTCTINYSK